MSRTNSSFGACGCPGHNLVAAYATIVRNAFTPGVHYVTSGISSGWLPLAPLVPAICCTSSALVEIAETVSLPQVAMVVLSPGLHAQRMYQLAYS
eukprot:4289892-Amphidinium_carterae.3